MQSWPLKAQPCGLVLAALVASGLPAYGQDDFNQVVPGAAAKTSQERDAGPVLTQTDTIQIEDEYYYDANGNKIPLPRSKRYATVKMASDGLSRDAGAVNLEQKYSWIKPDQSRALSGPAELGRQRLRLVEITDAAPRDLSSAVKGDPAIAAMNPVYVQGKQPMLVSDEFVVQFKTAKDRASAQTVAAKYNAELVRPVLEQDGLWVLRVKPGSGQSPVRVAATMYEGGDVALAQPDFLTQPSLKAYPNDPHYANAWHLNNTGQMEAKPGADAKVAAAWSLAKGENTIIAIFDSGVDMQHEDLKAKLMPGRDFIEGDNDPTPPEGESAHGTACAGVAAAITNNGIGVAGAAPEARILPIRLIGGDYVSDSDKAQAIIWAVDQGADVLSNSWGPPDGNAQDPTDPQHTVAVPIHPTMDKAFDYALRNGRKGKGCVIVWAAGNGNESVSYDGLASSPKVISVAASTDHDTKAFYSDFGKEVDVTAPSKGWGKRVVQGGEVYEVNKDDSTTTGIWSTDINSGGGYNSGSEVSGDKGGHYTNHFGGTSSSTPLVAGIAALVISANPELRWDEVHEIIKATADKIDPGDKEWNKYEQGHNPKYGFGRVNAERAVQEALRRKGGTGAGSSTAAGGQQLIRELAQKLGSNGTSNRNFKLSLVVDKPEKEPVYKIGEYFAYGAKCHQSCNLTVLSLNEATGEVSQILPNKHQPTVVLEPNKAFIVSKTGSVRIKVAPPAGTATLVAVASSGPFSMDQWKGKSVSDVLQGPWDVAIKRFKITDGTGGRDAAAPAGQPDLNSYFESQPDQAIQQQLEGGTP